VTSLPLGFMLDVDDGERLRFSDADVVIKASADTTGGAFAIVEEIAPLDTPLHVHEREDEVFYVLEGHHVIEVGDEAFPLGPGGLAFGPRGVPHAQRRLVPRTGRLLTMFSPAGFEGFFRELAEAERAGTIGPGAYTEVSKRYGITWLERASESA
jgi:mannose-6-phosphate isomerase-like protein (cupin superfamily)